VGAGRKDDRRTMKMHIDLKTDREIQERGSLRGIPVRFTAIGNVSAVLGKRLMFRTTDTRRSLKGAASKRRLRCFKHKEWRTASGF